MQRLSHARKGFWLVLAATTARHLHFTTPAQHAPSPSPLFAARPPLLLARRTCAPAAPASSFPVQYAKRSTRETYWKEMPGTMRQGSCMHARVLGGPSGSCSDRLSTVCQCSTCQPRPNDSSVHLPLRQDQAPFQSPSCPSLTTPSPPLVASLPCRPSTSASPASASSAQHARHNERCVIDSNGRAIKQGYRVARTWFNKVNIRVGVLGVVILVFTI